MKTTKSDLIKTLFSSVFFSILILGFSGKIFAQEKSEMKKSLNQAKEETLEEMKVLQIKIDDALDDLKKRLDMSEGTATKALEETKEELILSKEKLEGSMKEAKSVNNDNWGNVKKDFDEAYTVLEKDFESLQAKMEELFDDSK
ncbi:hypothetical protein HZR84_04765 [Hyphobacterium sp. CCMP332]|nr:hypothetical protein HZR84_04765 [Hyphobacterium sp. CCMP332]